jgi:hypothetical protein
VRRTLALVVVSLLCLGPVLLSGPASASPGDPSPGVQTPVDDYGSEAPEPAATPTPTSVLPPTSPTTAPSTPASAPSSTTTISGPPAHRAITVTLDFDDGTADQFQAAAQLQQRGLVGVFYVNSGRIGLTDNYLSVDQLRRLQAAGNEIGGHTVFHLHLPQQATVEQQRQICTDRNQLLALGFAVTDMAFPFGEFTPVSQAAVRFCGYNSVRTSEGNSGGGDTMPPADPYALKALSSLGPNTTTADIVAALVRAQTHGGGLVQLVFHKICTAEPCRGNAIHLTVFTQVLDWLIGQRQLGLVTTKTVHQVIGGAMRAAVPAPAPTATLTVANPSFVQGTLADETPTCWETTVNGDGNQVTWSPSRDAHSGRWAVHLSAAKVTGGVGLLVTQDVGTCAAPTTAGHRYTYGLWYKSSAPIHLVAYRRLPAGGYLTFGLSAAIAASPGGWSYASVLTRALPDDASGISIGVIVQDAGQFNFDDFTIADSGPVPPKTTPSQAAPPTTSATNAAAPAKASGPAPSVPALAIPIVAAAAVTTTRTGPSWSGAAWLGSLLLVSVLTLVAVDWRLARIRNGTRARH